MRKSFTRLFSLVMFLTLLSSFAMAIVTPVSQSSVWPTGTAALTRITDKLLVVYPDAVQASTGSVRVIKTDDGSLVTVIPATDSRISYAKGDTVTVDLSASLAELTSYTVSLDASTFKTVVAGKPSASYSWTFKTGDYTAPVLTTVDPIKGTTLTPLQTNYALVMTFSDQSAIDATYPMYVGTGKYVSIYKADGNLWDRILVSSGSIAQVGTTTSWKLTLPASRAFEDNTTYSVTIDAGAVTDNGQRADAKRNSYVGLTDKTVWTFSTKDYSAPVFAEGYPKAGAVTNTSASVLVKTTEVGKAYAVINTGVGSTTAIPPATIKSSGSPVTIATAGTEYSINFTVPFEGTTYVIHVVTENADGVLSTAETQISVKTSETQAPSLVAAGVSYNKGTSVKATGAVAGNVVTPDSGISVASTFNAPLFGSPTFAVDQTIDNIVLTFNEDVKIGVGNVTIYTADDNQILATISASSLTVLGDDPNTLAVESPKVKIPVSGLKNNTRYYVTMPNTLILDLYNNKYVGISAVNAWSFITNDIVAPTFTYTPVEGAIAQKNNVSIVLTFSELIRPVTTLPAAITVDQYNPANGVTTTVTGIISSVDIDNKFTKITIAAPVVSYVSGASVTVKIAYNSLVDVGGKYVDVAGQGINFTVEDKTPPSIDSWTNVTKASESEVLTFDEPIYLAGGGEVTNATLPAILTVKLGSDNTGSPVNYTATIDDAKQKITITPTSPWASEKTYFFAISSALQDKAGNGLTGILSTTTTIVDYTTATVDLSSVEGKTISTSVAAGTGTGLVMTFKETLPIASNEDRAYVLYNNIKYGYSNPAQMANVIVLKKGSAAGPDVPITNVTGGPASFNVFATLDSNSTYYFGIGASTQDASGNLNEPKFVTFSTLEEGAPKIVSLSPANGAVQVAAGSNLVLTFNTGVKLNPAYADGDIYLTPDNGVTKKLISGAEISISASGTIVTINPVPTKDVTNDLIYDIVVNPAKSVFLNKNTPNLAFAGIADIPTSLDKWKFATSDTKLGLLTLSPDNTATGVPATQITPIDAKLEMTFNEKVVKGLGTFKIWNMTTLALVESIDVTSSQVVLSGDQKTITITPSSNFSYNSTYYVEVTAGTVKDAVGNGNDAIYGTANATSLTNWTFGTPNPALQIVKTTPANLADKVGPSSSIIIEFNREVAPGATGSVGYVIWDGITEQPKLDPINSTNVTFSGKTMTIWHAEAFPSGKTIFIKLEANTVVAKNDATIKNPVLDRNFSAPLYATPIQFSVDDTNPPVPTFTPALFSSTTPVYTSVNSDITLTFDEAIYNYISGTLVTSGNATSDGLFTISPSVPFSAIVSNSNRTVTIHPTSPLTEFTPYTVSVVGDKIKDGATPTAHGITTAVIAADNLLSAADRKYSSTFFTEDKTVPTVVFAGLAPYISGGDKQITVPAITVGDLNLINSGAKGKFYYLLRVKSTDAAPTADQIKAANSKDASTGTISTFDITSLSPSTTYQFYYVADDAFGNTTTVSVLEASTIDTVAPLLVSTTPATSSVDVDVPSSGLVVKLTFNENVVPGSGSVTVRDYATQVLLSNTTTLIPVLSSTSDPKSLNLTIPAGTFTTAPQKFYIEIPSGAIKDSPALNPFIGLSGKDALVLTTDDNAAPTVDIANSTNGADIAIDASITVAFSENVKAGTGNLVLYRGTATVPNAIQVFTPAQATFVGNKVTVKPTANLSNNQFYIVRSELGFAKDLSSNSNASLLGDISFTTTPNVNLFVSTVVPAGGSTAIDKATLTASPYITATFSGDVYLTVAGYHKSLALLTQAELLAHVSLKDAVGNSVVISQIDKVLTPGFNGLIIRVATSALKDQTNYTLTISGFENLAGTVMTTKVVNYLTSDATPPVITFNPVKDAPKVDPSSSLTLTFSEAFYDYVVASIHTIYAEVTNTNVKSFVSLKTGVTAGAFTTTGVDVDFSATVSGNVITIVPTAKLKSGVTYYYGLIRPVMDINTTPIVLNTNGTSYVPFTVADYAAPVLETFTATNHSPQGVGISATADMYVDFNEAISVSTGSIIIRREDGTIFQTVSGAGLSIGSSVTAAPLNTKRLLISHNAFEPYTNYFVEVGASVVVDAQNNPNVKFSDPLPATGWLFTTNDTYALTATVTPNGTNTPRSTNLVMTFNKVPVGQANKFINVYKADGTAVSHVLASGLVPNGRVVTIPVSLEANQSYYARVEAGAFTDGKVPVNAFAGILDNSWAFSTVNDIAPKVVALLPADNAANLDPSTNTFTMTFDREIAAGTGLISVRYALDGKVFEDVNVATAIVDKTAKTLTFKVSKTFDANTNFYVYVSAGVVVNTEITKDAFAGILDTYTWNFSTSIDKVNPTLVSKTPSAETITGNHPTLVMTFDENVVLGAGNVKIVKKSDNTTAVTIPVTASMVSGKTVSVTYTYDATKGGLEKNTDYYVLVDAGAVKDVAANAFAGVTASTTWTFKTGTDYVTIDPVIDNSLEFKVYPNPFVDDVKVDNASELTKVVVSNIAGQVVKEVVNPTGTIQLNELRSGVYFMSLYQGNTVIKTVKIAKR